MTSKTWIFKNFPLFSYCALIFYVKFCDYFRYNNDEIKKKFCFSSILEESAWTVWWFETCADKEIHREKRWLCVFCTNLRKGMTHSPWSYVGKIAVNPTLEEVKIMGISLFDKAKALGKRLFEWKLILNYGILNECGWLHTSVHGMADPVATLKFGETKNVARQNTCNGNSGIVARRLRYFVC